MAKYSERNKSAAGDQAPRTINVTDDQSYEYRKDRGYVTVTYYFHGKVWQDWATLMATKGIKGAQMSFFLGANYDPANKIMSMRGGFSFGVWMEKYTRRFDDIKFRLASDKGVKLGIPSDDDELKYIVNGQEISEIIRQSDEMEAAKDAQRTMREISE